MTTPAMIAMIIPHGVSWSESSVELVAAVGVEAFAEAEAAAELLVEAMPDAEESDAAEAWEDAEAEAPMVRASSAEPLSPTTNLSLVE